MKNRKNLWMALALLVAAMAALPSCSKRNPSGGKCRYCAMKVKLPQDLQGAKLVIKEGKAEFFCNAGHAMKGWGEAVGTDPTKKNPDIKLFVVDYNKKSLIDSKDAVFVYGSDVKSVNKEFKKSSVAFKTVEEANAFIKEHKGITLNFYGLSRAYMSNLPAGMMMDTPAGGASPHGTMPGGAMPGGAASPHGEMPAGAAPGGASPHGDKMMLDDSKGEKPAGH